MKSSAVSPELTIIINGGISDLAQCAAHLQHVDGVMLGRAAYQNPELLLLADTLYGARRKRSLPYCRKSARSSPNAWHVAKCSRTTPPPIGIVPGVRGAKHYRRILSEEARAPDAGIEVFMRALAAVGHA